MQVEGSFLWPLCRSPKADSQGLRAYTNDIFGEVGHDTGFVQYWADLVNVLCYRRASFVREVEREIVRGPP